MAPAGPPEMGCPEEVTNTTLPDPTGMVFHKWAAPVSDLVRGLVPLAVACGVGKELAADWETAHTILRHELQPTIAYGARHAQQCLEDGCCSCGRPAASGKALRQCWKDFMRPVLAKEPPC